MTGVPNEQPSDSSGDGILTAKLGLDCLLKRQKEGDMITRNATHELRNPMLSRLEQTNEE